MEDQKVIETENLRKYIKKLEIDTYGVAFIKGDGNWTSHRFEKIPKFLHSI